MTERGSNVYNSLRLGVAYAELGDIRAACARVLATHPLVRSITYLDDAVVFKVGAAEMQFVWRTRAVRDRPAMA
jgi:hypothetical protein